MATEAWVTFEARMREIEDLSATLGLLGWDEQTFCSHKGRTARAQHSATLATLTHERTIDPHVESIVAWNRRRYGLDSGRATLDASRFRVPPRPGDQRNLF